MRRRVVITGLGIVSCLGNEPGEVARALREGRSGLSACPAYREAGMRSLVAGLPSLQGEPPVDRKARRFMGQAALYAHHALRKAIDDARLPGEAVSHARTALVVGAGAGSLTGYVSAIDTARTRGVGKVAPFVVPQTMASSASACLATAFGVRGPSFTVSGACASAAHAIGQAAELIRSGRHDVVLTGGAEEAEWTSALPFDAMGALSTAHNATPQAASRPYDARRDGFVMAAGAGMLVLEALEHAQARGGRVHAELCGYGASSGGDMVLTTKEAAAAAVQAALDDAGLARVDYINTHANGSGPGDPLELAALREVFAADVPPLSSTKGLSGHALGASAAQEAIYCLLMLNEGFIAGCANLEAPDPACAGLPLVHRTLERRIESALSISLGFGGTNAAIVLGRLKPGAKA